MLLTFGCVIVRLILLDSELKSKMILGANLTLRRTFLVDDTQTVAMSDEQNTHTISCSDYEYTLFQSFICCT